MSLPPTAVKQAKRRPPVNAPVALGATEAPKRRRQSKNEGQPHLDFTQAGREKRLLAAADRWVAAAVEAEPAGVSAA